MGRIVLGMGCSHTPQISSPVSLWPDHAARDQRNSELLADDGEFHTYQDLLDSHPDGWLASELTEEAWTSKLGRANEAIDLLAQHLRAARPDVVIVVGDDQRELFAGGLTPAIALFTGEELIDVPPTPERLAQIPAGIRAAQWARHGDGPEAYPVDGGLSAHLAERLTLDGFDIARMERQAPGTSLGHAFTLVRRRLGLAPEIPIVPVILNTFFQPNVPSAGRCYALGQALARAVGDWRDARVAVLGSGGLSHYVVLPEFDHVVLDALKRRDAEALAALPRRFFRTGTSETLNWITAAGAAEDLEMDLVDYIPGYRSPAGTGTGIAFALWQAREGAT